MVGGVTILSFVVLLYVIELFDSLSGHRLDDNGIRPLETDGLWGIVFAPLLHANWDHLIANTDPGADPRLPDDARRACRGSSSPPRSSGFSAASAPG